jgi:hypothetical protein
VFCASVLASGVWWPLHNYLNVGDPFPSFTTPANQFELPFSEKIIETPGTLRLIFETSFWPDWASRFLPRGLALFCVLATGALLAALFIATLLARKRRPEAEPASFQNSEKFSKMRNLQAMSLCAFLFLLLGILQYVWFKDYMGQIGGRYLLNGLPWLLVFCGSSVALLADRIDGGDSARQVTVPDKTMNAVTGASATLLAIISCVALGWWFMASAYLEGIIKNAVG